jgi:hypothetical protein
MKDLLITWIEGRRAPPTFLIAMQKVVGSNPISRLTSKPR